MSNDRDTRVTLVGSRAGIGGTERHLSSLVRGLPGRGFDVELITSERGPLTETAAASGVRTTCIERTSRITYFRNLVAHLRKTRPTVLHAHSGRLPCLAARLADVPWILDTRHGHLDARLDPDEDVRPLGHSFQPSTSQRAAWRVEGAKAVLPHLTLTVCERDRETLVRLGGVPPEKVRAVWNGIPQGTGSGRRVDGALDPYSDSCATVEADLGAGADSGVDLGVDLVVDSRAGEATFLRIGWLGRMAEQKAPERVIELCAWLLADDAPGQARLPASVRDRLRLEMHGDGPLRAELEALAGRLGIGDRVSFPGPTGDVFGVLRPLGLFLLPSRKEGLPYVLLEALAAGVPVLSTPVGGAEEVLTDELAEGVRPWNLGEWGRISAGWLVDPSRRERLCEVGRERVRAFEEEAMVDQIAELYREGPDGR
ncbi:MAG: glycosyltransferase [Candidatus Eisenbacteria bacterium]